MSQDWGRIKTTGSGVRLEKLRFVSSRKKLAYPIAPACGRQGLRNLKLRTAWGMAPRAKGEIETFGSHL
jgi:hypothetical protein